MFTLSFVAVNLEDRAALLPDKEQRRVQDGDYHHERKNGLAARVCHSTCLLPHGSIIAQDVVVHAHVAQLAHVIIEVAGDSFEHVEPGVLG